LKVRKTVRIKRKRRNTIKEIKQGIRNASYGNELGKGENYKTEYYRLVRRDGKWEKYRAK
jgi:hypothetical protein